MSQFDLNGIQNELRDIGRKLDKPFQDMNESRRHEESLNEFKRSNDINKKLIESSQETAKWTKYLAIATIILILLPLMLNFIRQEPEVSPVIHKTINIKSIDYNKNTLMNKAGINNLTIVSATILTGLFLLLTILAIEIKNNKDNFSSIIKDFLKKKELPLRISKWAYILSVIVLTIVLIFSLFLKQGFILNILLTLGVIFMVTFILSLLYYLSNN